MCRTARPIRADPVVTCALIFVTGIAASTVTVEGIAIIATTMAVAQTMLIPLVSRGPTAAVVGSRLPGGVTAMVVFIGGVPVR